MNAGDLLRNYRMKSGMSVRDLGAKIGVSGAYISQIEKGDRALPQKRISGFSEALGLSVNEKERLKEVCTFKNYKKEVMEIAEGLLRFTREVPAGYEVQITLRKISEE